MKKILLLSVLFLTTLAGCTKSIRPVADKNMEMKTVAEFTTQGGYEYMLYRIKNDDGVFLVAISGRGCSMIQVQEKAK